MKAMRKASNLLLLIPLFIHQVLLCVSISATFQLAVAAIVKGDPSPSIESNAIELNPNYLEDSDCDDSSSDDESYDSDYDTDETDDEEDENSKSSVNKALSKSTKKASKTIQILQKHRTKITIAFAVFAFRREISNFFLHLLTTNQIDKDGKETRKLIVKLNPTAIIKIILFIDFMRKMQTGNSSGSSGDISSISNDEKPSGLISGIIRDFLQPGNTAYIPPIEQHYTFEHINDRYTKDGNAWKKVTSSKPNTDDSSFYKEKEQKQLKIFSSFFNRSKATNWTETTEKDTNDSTTNESTTTPTTVILEMKLDSNVNSMSLIRDQISFLLHQHRLNRKEANNAATENSSSTNYTSNESLSKDDFSDEHLNSNSETTASSLVTKPQLEVVIILESPGGSATDYGLVSNIIYRLRKEPGIKLTICVDKVAASGGYMIACMASPNQLYASPFAVVGSIGVYGQTLNIHNTLQNWGVKPLVFRGGKDKAPVGLVGEITKEGIAKVQGMIDKTHSAFKKHVVNARPVLKENIDNIATGDVWLGYDALDVGLVDKILTSDEYIWDKIQNGEKVLKLIKFQKPRLGLFGSPKYGPGVPGVFHRMVQSMTDITNDIQTALHNVNKILEDIPTSNNDFTKVISATSTIRTQSKNAN